MPNTNGVRSLPTCDLTDLPRLLCGCREHNEWAFNVGDLEPSELAYLEGHHDVPARARAFDPASRPLTVVALPAYVTQEWTAATNPPLPRAGATCQVCGKCPAGDAFVCPDCLDDLRVHLGDVPGLLVDLEVLASREAVVNTRPRESRRSSHTRWDQHLHAPQQRPQLVRTEGGVRLRFPVSDNPGQVLASAGYNRPLHVERAVLSRDEIGNEVSTSLRVIADSHRIPYGPMDTAAASRWLLVQLPVIALDPAGPDIARGMRRAHHRAMAVVDNVEDGIYLGLCDKCRAKMYADPEFAEHRCTTCGETYDVGKRREQQRDKVRNSLLSVGEIVKASESDSQTFGAKLTTGQVEGWVRRGRLLRANPVGSDEAARYRAMDVHELVAQRREAAR